MQQWLRYLVGSETFDVYQTLSADVTLDETISALDASVIAQYVAELITELPHIDVSALTGAGDFAIEDGEFNVGEIIEIPIQLIGGDNLLSFEMDIEYDPEIVSFAMVVWSDMIEHFSIEENNESGLLRVAGSGSTPDGVEGVFGNLQVFVDGGFEGESFDITINEYRVNENDFVENIVATFNKTSVGIGDLYTTPDIYSLHQNYPNPFNPSTQISYNLPEDAMVNINVYDLMGRSVRTLVSSNQITGYRSVRWDGKNNLGEGVSAGMYIYMIQAGKFRQTKKMVLLK